MPVRGFFPFVAVEDREAGVLWGARLACPGSWQMEVYRRDDFVALSGGQADREFGHWFKTLQPGDTYETPAATLACVKGNLDQLAGNSVDDPEAADATAPQAGKLIAKRLADRGVGQDIAERGANLALEVRMEAADQSGHLMRYP